MAGRCKTTEPLWLSDMDVADALRKKPLEINKRFVSWPRPPESQESRFLCSLHYDRGPKQDALRLYWVPNDFKNLVRALLHVVLYTMVDAVHQHVAMWCARAQTHHARKCRTPRLRCYPGGRFQQHLTPEQVLLLAERLILFIVL